jgi:hypothetical protein
VGETRKRRTLWVIRASHSAVFLVMLSAIVWLVVSGARGRRDRTVAVAGGLVAIESAVFVLNDGVCPLTPLAERHGAERGGVSDIFLPDALARTIPIWATGLVLLGISLHVRAWIRRRGGARRGADGSPADARGLPRPTRWRPAANDIEP